MKYRNAATVLPRRLLQAVQAYACGEILYIPAGSESKSEWGARNGAKTRYRERNAEICSRHKNGESFEALASVYFLSEDSIRKIVKRHENL